MTKDEMINAFNVADSPAEGNPRHQSTVSMMATMPEKTTVMTQARNPCENCPPCGRECVLRKDTNAATQKMAGIDIEEVGCRVMRAQCEYGWIPRK